MYYVKSDVLERFEALFQDKNPIPQSLFDVWFDMAVSKLEIELGYTCYDSYMEHFTEDTHSYILDILAEYIKLYYQEREVSKVNKRISIVGKDISIDGSNGSKKYVESELAYIKEKSSDMVDNLKPTAYA